MYKCQDELTSIIKKYGKISLNSVISNLPNITIFLIDFSWPSCRKAAHSIVVFLDIRSKLKFEFLIVSKSSKISDIDFHSLSNLMENEALKFKREKYI